MEENINKEEKKIDIGLLLVMLLILLVLALIFILIGENTNPIRKKVKDDNIRISVPYSYEVIESNEAAEDENDGYIHYYYIHKDYGLTKEQIVNVLMKDILYDEWKYSDIYKRKLDGYDALQYNYIYLDHSGKISGFYYVAGLATLIELEDRFLVINVYEKVDVETGETMNLEDIQLDFYNKIMDTLKIHDNTANMHEPDDTVVNFAGLDITLPGYWSVFMSSKVNISFNNDEFSYAMLIGHAVQKTENVVTEYYINKKENIDLVNDDEYIGEYMLDGEPFTVFIDNGKEIVAVSDKCYFIIKLYSYELDYIADEVPKQALLEMIFGE
ncbi:MAG: hypothetical protein AB1Z23_12440 [Eubacteriales bacterium]